MRCFIVAIDQHAAHERIRLERLLQHLATEVRSGGATVKKVSGEGVALRLTSAEQKFFKEVPLALPLFRRWGLTCALQADSSSYVVHAMITTVPDLLANRLAFEHPELERAFHDYVGTLIDRAACDFTIGVFLDNLEDQAMELANVLRWCPPRFVDLAKSNACRGQSVQVETFQRRASSVVYVPPRPFKFAGAIMFNDPLSLSQCQNLVQDLGRTRDPFHCAHGRPSLSVLCEISFNTNLDMVHRLMGDRDRGPK
jgi:DNA mismatch repair protein MLH3